jgi:hypothetical protein
LGAFYEPVFSDGRRAQAGRVRPAHALRPARCTTYSSGGMKELVIFIAFAAFIVVARLAVRQGHR